MVYSLEIEIVLILIKNNEFFYIFEKGQFIDIWLFFVLLFFIQYIFFVFNSVNMVIFRYFDFGSNYRKIKFYIKNI